MYENVKYSPLPLIGPSIGHYGASCFLLNVPRLLQMLSISTCCFKYFTLTSGWDTGLTSIPSLATNTNMFLNFSHFATSKGIAYSHYVVLNIKLLSNIFIK